MVGNLIEFIMFYEVQDKRERKSRDYKLYQMKWRWKGEEKRKRADSEIFCIIWDTHRYPHITFITYSSTVFTI